MSRVLLRCAGGEVLSPEPGAVLVGREHGGHLIVNPPREVWERGELGRDELAAWSCLVAAAGTAMLRALPQLREGCINYWDAGNWALNDAAEPAGRKTAREFRRVHLHLLGRSPAARDPDLLWGEAPRFPAFAQRKVWSARHAPLSADECAAVAAAARGILRTKYDLACD